MNLLRDIRLTFRNLLKARRYSVATVITLALAIGANSAIFSAVYAILLKPLHIRQPDELVICWEADRSHNLAVVELSYRNFQDWATHSRSFTQTAAVGSSTWPAILEGRGKPARLSSAGVSASFFQTLGVAPMLGRVFGPEDDLPNAARVVVLSHALWIRRFGGDPGIVGTTLHLDEPHTVVGIMPEGFDFPRATDFWTPVVPILAASGQKWRTEALENVGVLFVIGRLREGITPPVAAEELNQLAGHLQRVGTANRFGATVVVTPFLDYLLGPVRQALWALFAAVGVLLLIACANVSGLMLTRVSLKHREDAIRLALGATRARLGYEWVLEAVLLSVVGGCLGLIASQWIARAIVALAPDDIPRVSDIAINLPVTVFTFAAVLTTALLCGAAPVRHAGRANLVDALNDAARATPGRQSQRARSLLLVCQIGLTVVLLVAAGLVVRSFMNLRKIDLGFVPENVVTMNVGPSDPKPSANEWVRELLGRVAALPNVEAAGAVYLRPLALGPIGQETWVILDGQPDTPSAARQNPALNYQVATPGYFAAMRIPLKRGRLFNDQDSAQSPRVALVGESTARRLWPGEDPIGKRILMPTYTPGAPNAWRTVVGVVSDVRYRGIDDLRLDVYDSALQSTQTAQDVVVLTSGDLVSVAAAVQAEARRLDSRVLIDRVTTMDAIVSRAMAPWRFSVWMFTLFAMLAFALATIGLFSLVTLDVAHRRHEIAVRLALGAQRNDVLRSVLMLAGWRVFPGVTLGLVTTMLATRAIRSILFEVQPLDRPTYLTVTALVLGVAFLASYVPARTAAGIDPLPLLRRE